MVGSATVTSGKKGLEAAARDARYSYLHSLPGKIATAHTADDNAETVLLHLIRGTGLKGLGGITPITGNVIRPMLSTTRQDVENFLQEWSLPHIEDSSNQTDAFLRNHLRHHVIPLLTQENPQFAENTSAMALRLRLDEACLTQAAETPAPISVSSLREQHPAIRSRILENFLKQNCVREPEASHLSLLESLVYSDNPSAAGHFPGNITIARRYDTLVRLDSRGVPEDVLLPPCGTVELPQWGIRVSLSSADAIINTANTFTFHPQGQLRLRSRRSGDELQLPGGTKSLKKRFIDRKIPASQRDFIPILEDDAGILAVYGFGTDLRRVAQQLPALQIHIEKYT
jgi:tRNA(Ile)-lysidine synthase